LFIRLHASCSHTGTQMYLGCLINKHGKLGPNTPHVTCSYQIIIAATDKCLIFWSDTQHFYTNRSMKVCSICTRSEYRLATLHKSTFAFVYCKHKFNAAQLVAISFTKNRSITKLTPYGSQFDSRWRQQFFVIS
jgi:hypothetical protein